MSETELADAERSHQSMAAKLRAALEDDRHPTPSGRLRSKAEART